MALVLKDRVKETSTTTGTGTFTLAGAASGFQSFSAIGNGNTTYYAIDGGAEWEVGIGTYSSTGTTLSRNTILSSSNGGTAVNFSAGTKNVFVTYPAGKGIYTDASGNAIALGTPASATLTNATGLPISTGVSGLGTGVATFLATPSAANLASAVTDETGSGSLVFATLPTFDTTGIKFSGSTSGTTTVLSGAVAGTSVLTLPVATDTLVGKATTDTLTNKTLTSPSLTTPVLGTPSSGTLTSCTGLPLTTGVTGVLPVANGGTNASTASITSFNNITGYTAAGATGTTSTNLVFSTSPTLVTPALGTPASGVVTNLTGTASININGTVGATTASTGAFTTLSASSIFTASAGTALLPSIVTSSGSTSGLYSSTANVIGVSISATSIGTFTSTGLNGMAIGATTASTGAFTTLSASSTVSGTGFSTYLASPPAIGGTAAAAGNFTNSQIASLGINTAASGTSGEIRATNNITAFYSSDRNLKENIKDVNSALDKVCAIGSKTFDWKDEVIKAKGGEDGYFVQKSDFGVIAQDVQAVFPQAVRTRQDGTLAVDYEKLATLAFGAIKELAIRMEALENK